MKYVILLLVIQVCQARETVYIDQIGNYNTIVADQTSDYYATNSNINATVRDNNNEIYITQNTAIGTQTANVSVSGGNKIVNITQQDGPHSADVTLSGTPTSLSLTQSGTSAQNFYINFNCATVGGCQQIQVQQ